MNLADLGRRAAACKHWRWMDGMAANELPGYRIVSNNCEGHAYLTDGHDLQSVKDCSPDLSDPATLGCLLHLVREAYGDLSLQPNDAGEYDMLHWHVFIRPNFACMGHATEAEALVAALEAAP